MLCVVQCVTSIEVAHFLNSGGIFVAETPLSEEAMEIYRAIFALSPHIRALNDDLPYLLSQKERINLEINMLKEKISKLEKLVDEYTPKRYGI